MLTQLEITTAKPKAKPYNLPVGQALVLAIQTSGSKLWRFRYRYADRQKTLHIGPWPATSLGSTFERVYGEIKRMLAEGELPPGTAIEPAMIGKEIAASITPVHDALHRLTGERLVEAPNHNGFRVPIPSEAALRDLYHWNGQVLALAAKRVAPDAATVVEDRGAMPDIVASTGALVLSVAHAAGSVELAVTVRSLSDRLATARRAEVAMLPAMTDELSGLAAIIASGDRAELAAALTRYHRRRIASVAKIVAHLMRYRVL